jgi:hypothetical protein
LKFVDISFKNVVLGLLLIGCVIMTTGATNRPNVKLVSETIVIYTGDTISDIAGQYMTKNTGTRRQLDEFTEGIIELNYDLLKERPSHCIVYPDDQIKVNYWIRE